MSKTSKKLFDIKNSSIKQQYQKTNIDDDEILLLEQPKETDELFRKLSIPSKKDFIDESLKDVREINAYQSKYNDSETYKGEFIKKLCNDYFLKIRPLSELYSFLDEEHVKKIQEFAKNFENVLISSNRFQILTHREYFEYKSKGKECKIFIIFYKPNDNSSSISSGRVKKDSILIQVCSSGNDFSDSRLWLKFLDKKVYVTGGSSKLFANFASLTLIICSININLFTNYVYSALVLTIIGCLILVINNLNNNFQSDNYWNKNLNDD